MTTVITWETPREEIERASSIIANELKDKFKNGDYPHACSDLIHLEVISTLSEIATKLNLPLSAMKDDRKYVYWWMLGMPTMRMFVRALPEWMDFNLNQALGAPILATKNIEKLPEDISTSCYMFCMFAVWYGSKPECKRRILNNRATKTLQNVIRSIGVNGILNQMWMAATQYVILGEKVFEPAWARMTSGKDARAVNSMSARSVEPVRRGRKVEYSSFADLAQAVSK